MLKSSVLSAVLIAGFTAGITVATAAPLNDGSGNGAKTISEPAPRAGANEPMPPAGGGADAPYRSAPDAPPAVDCPNCPPPKHYDSTEIIKNSRDVDQSRVINTTSENTLPPKVREINKLIVRENETRNVGVVQHNHTIIDREIRYVKRAPVRQYVPVQRVRVETVWVAAPQPSCSCGCGCGGQSAGYGYGYAQYAAPVQYALVPVETPRAYGYRTVPSNYGYGYAYR